MSKVDNYNAFGDPKLAMESYIHEVYPEAEVVFRTVDDVGDL